jgi:hypothetical protein
MDDNTAQYTVAIPRLYDKYVEATANNRAPDRRLAIEMLDEIISRAMKARAILQKSA